MHRLGMQNPIHQQKLVSCDNTEFSSNLVADGGGQTLTVQRQLLTGVRLMLPVAALRQALLARRRIKLSILLPRCMDKSHSKVVLLDGVA